MCSSVWAVDTSREGGDVMLPAESPLAGSLGTEGGRVGGWGGGVYTHPGAAGVEVVCMVVPWWRAW